MNGVARFLLVLLLCYAMACGTSGNPVVRAEPPHPAAKSRSWTPIALADINDRGVRQAVTDLLKLVDSDFLWPGFVLDHAVIVVDTRDLQHPVAYCVGQCTPEVNDRGVGTSRVWRTDAPTALAAGHFRYASLKNWALRGDGEVVAVGFDDRENTVVAAVHEDFHLNYQSSYTRDFGDEIGGSDARPSQATRENLQGSYSRSTPVAGELRDECSALVTALHSGRSDRKAAFAALGRFVAIRAARRSRPGAPSFEEDFWERQEGVPTNLERRMAAIMKFPDPSILGVALAGRGCDEIPNAAYFLLIGGLEAAVLDVFGDSPGWEGHVYPRDRTSASSLYFLVRALFMKSEER